MEPVIKLNHIDANQIKKIYVFKGDRDIEEEDDLGPGGHDIFSAAEQSAIETEGIDIVLVEASLHSDDTIGIIKGKITKHLELERASEELYLFGIEEGIVSPSGIVLLTTKSLHCRNIR